MEENPIDTSTQRPCGPKRVKHAKPYQNQQKLKQQNDSYLTIFHSLFKLYKIGQKAALKNV